MMPFCSLGNTGIHDTSMAVELIVMAVRLWGYPDGAEKKNFIRNSPMS